MVAGTCARGPSPVVPQLEERAKVKAGGEAGGLGRAAPFRGRSPAFELAVPAPPVRLVVLDDAAAEKDLAGLRRHHHLGVGGREAVDDRDHLEGSAPGTAFLVHRRTLAQPTAIKDRFVHPHLSIEQAFAEAAPMRREDLDELWKIKNLRRSLAMPPPGAPGFLAMTPCSSSSSCGIYERRANLSLRAF